MAAAGIMIWTAVPSVKAFGAGTAVNRAESVSGERNSRKESREGILAGRFKATTGKATMSNAQKEEPEEIQKSENQEPEKETSKTDEGKGQGRVESSSSKPAAKQQGKSSSTGDLWDDWYGDVDFPGDGTRTAPYQLSSPGHLMGLSEMVAAGESFKGRYFQLVQDVDLGSLEMNDGSWNPIGWYQNREDMGEAVTHGFSGNFDGGGHTISGLRIHQGEERPDYAGLFGWIDGGTVSDLKVEAEEIYGGDKTAVLAGAVTGRAKIYNVQVSGYVYATGDAGGIAGVADGKKGRVTIENCRARGIAIRSEGGSSFTGGIAGQVVKADLVDNEVATASGNRDRIRGKGYTGGITGCMKQSNLYNSYVEGTVGGNGGKAVGGMVGLYDSGNLILARFAGEIGRTYNGTAAREGTFVGTRQGMFTYGTEKESNLSYLFTNAGVKAQKVFGSDRDGDNTFTAGAHIGYWTDQGTRYVTVAGITQTGCGDRYFYEELEDGVRYLVTRKLGNHFTAEDYDRGLSFSPDHFAPGYQGEPVKGYLLSVPRIDAANANGTYDTDVASLAAIPTGANTYYRTIDKDHSAAVAPGVTVSVVTAAKNTGNNRYQMVMNDREPGGVKPPVYTDESGRQAPMTYVNGGSYSFVMPECNTQINAEYVKVTTKITMDPAETVIGVTHTRKGDRKNPDILTEVKNQEGVLIARYINGSPDSETEVHPVRIHGEHNTWGSTADRTVTWSVDDRDLLLLTSSPGYTEEDAMVMPNLNSSFILEILNRETGRQADSGYAEPISPVIYERSAVVTAASNPATSADRRAVYGNCKVTVTLQILDQTTRRVEGLNLSQADLVCKITRKLTGDRKNPTETITCSQPAVLAADLYPRQPFYKHVAWKDQKGGQILKLSPTGDHQENCRVDVRFDPQGKENPAWIQNVILADNERKKKDPYRKLEGSGVYHETVTATAEDQTNGVVSAVCNVKLLFVTEDETRIRPETILVEPLEHQRELSVVKTGNPLKPVITYKGFDAIQLKASVLPEYLGEAFEPYDRGILWSSGDKETLAVTKDGSAVPEREAAWIQEVMRQASASSGRKAEGTRKIPVYAKARAGSAEGKGEIVLHLTVEDKTMRRQGGSSGGSQSGGGGGQGGGSGLGGGPGTEAVMAANSIKTAGVEAFRWNSHGQGKKGKWEKTIDGTWMFLADGIICRDQWIFAENSYADGTKGQSGSDWFRFDSRGHMVTGWFTDEDGRIYYLNPVSDNTKGKLMTGWNWITGEDGKARCYYFQEVSDGYRGALLRNQTTPDGYEVNGEGAWTVGNQAQTRQ